MELDLNKAFLLSFVSILALPFPCRATTWSPGHNLSVVVTASPPCGVSEASCRIADLQPELEGIADPGMLGASLVATRGGHPLVPNVAGCGRKLPSGRNTPCPPHKNPPPHCDEYCRTKCPC